MKITKHTWKYIVLLILIAIYFWIQHGIQTWYVIILIAPMYLSMKVDPALRNIFNRKFFLVLDSKIGKYHNWFVLSVFVISMIVVIIAILHVTNTSFLGYKF